MRFGTIFLHVSAAVFAAGMTLHAMHGDPERVAQAPAVTPPPPIVGPVLASDLPAPRGPKALLGTRLRAAGFTFGDPVFVRVIKDEKVLEVWLERDGRYRLFDSFPICFFSGALGPKLKEGDGQSPEGFYAVGRRQLNPASAYHLAFNIGYPNAYDRANGRTGAALMVHGNCVSIGCYAMTDYGITEIYALVDSALQAGQGAVAVHIFPFRMTDEAMAAAADADPIAFWRELKPGFDAFEATHEPPEIFVCDRHYALAGGGTCDRVASW